jgi:hypothetical protein
VARLIPSFTDDRTPPGERDVFNLLASGPDEWVALHSLDLAPWNRGLRTEVDFVVIVPEAGILCIEVKSQENLSFDGERWYPASITRSPFKQASDARHTLYRRLSDLAPQFKRVPVVHCCIFARARFELPPNLSVQPWELLDGPALRTFHGGGEFCADLKLRIEQSVGSDSSLTPLERRLSAAEIESLVRYCVPVQRRHPDRREEILRRQHELDRVLREHQKPLVQLAALNERIVVSGGAGTGKTLIAMEAARRAAEAGRRVALLCFNQLVGDWMRRRLQEMAPSLPNLVVGRAIRVMAEMAGVEIPEDPSPDFWDRVLPERVEERLTDPDFKASASIDYLVLDEAQDVLARPWLWDCLAQCLTGGIQRGSFMLLGDFDHQVLAQRDLMQRALAATYETSRAVRWRLAENCRNYRIIGDTAVRLSGLNGEVYSGYLRSGGGVENYDIFFYDHDREQLEGLGRLLRDFKSQGYKPSEITLLSLRTDQLSAATRLKQSGWRLRPAWQHGEQTGYSSIHAFKGLENKVIILTDMLLEGREFHRDLFYTGMTRATESVRVLCDRRSEGTIVSWFAGGGAA